MIEKKLLKLFDKQIRSNIVYYGGDLRNVEKQYKLILLYFIPIFSLIIISLILFKLFIFIPFLLISIIFTILYPLIYTWVQRIEYKRQSDLEGPFFLVLVYLNSLLDKGILASLEEGSRMRIFKVINKELLQIKKEVVLRGSSIRKALSNRALNVRDNIFGKIYMNYISAEDIGVSLSQRMRELLQDVFNWMKENYENYLNFITSIIESIFSIFILVPVLLIAFQSVFNISLLQLLLPLALVPAIYLLISVNQPDLGHRVRIRVLDVILFIVSSAIIFILPIELSYKIYGIIIIYSIFSIKYYLILKNNEKVINILPDILKKLSDSYQLGHSIKSSLQKLDYKTYKLLQTTSNTNWVVNYILSLLEIIENKGSEASINIINELNNIIITINGIKKKLLNSLRFYSILNYITPLILWFTLSMTSYNGTHSPIPLSVILISYSAALSLLFTKISEFTILKPFHVFLTSTLALILTLIPPSLISII